MRAKEVRIKWKEGKVEGKGRDGRGGVEKKGSKEEGKNKRWSEKSIEGGTDGRTKWRKEGRKEHERGIICSAINFF